MIKHFIFNSMIIAFAAFTITSCIKPKSLKEGKMNSELGLKNDKTVYGLACEGCTDSVLIFLPGDGSDPIKYDIIDAHNNHKIFGHPETGDWIAIIINKKDKGVVDEVIDLDQLKGTWCYMVMPRMRDAAHMSAKMRARMIQNLPDSIKNTFLVPREYGLTIGRQYSARTIGYNPLNKEEDSPVEYPAAPLFSGWHIWNGKLVLTEQREKKKKDGSTEFVDWRLDTTEIVTLMKDSLVIKGAYTQCFYRKGTRGKAKTPMVMP